MSHEGVRTSLKGPDMNAVDGVLLIGGIHLTDVGAGNDGTVGSEDIDLEDVLLLNHHVLSIVGATGGKEQHQHAAQ